MSAPTVIDIPHDLGQAEAIRRIRSRIGELPAHIPGGVAQVAATWPAENRMALDIAALGQSLSGTLEVEERLVRVTMALPLMLSFMSGAIAAAVKAKGGQLLLADDAAPPRA